MEQSTQSEGAVGDNGNSGAAAAAAMAALQEDLDSFRLVPGSSGSSGEGVLVFERVNGRTVATRAYAQYPLRFMLPSKVARDGVDCMWAYAITFGGGVVAGDSVAFRVELGERCTAAITTQASTKVYHSLSPSLVSEQSLTAVVSRGSLLAVIPDPVTCFKGARYLQKQVFDVRPGGSLLLVDWLSSGRRGRGEVWELSSYRSMNQVFVENGRPLLLDTVDLHQSKALSLSQRMHGLHVVATAVLVGPRTLEAQHCIKDGSQKVSQATIKRVKGKAAASRAEVSVVDDDGRLMVSHSSLGIQGDGLIVRIAGDTTERVYRFLRSELACMSSHLGVGPYELLG